ncbi:hypothetical protein BU26DRAFT_422632 [Trematosphaeria pertusa]|uniref:MARVEL domain-containing protein n=1 Tax=Trematosphaeria pertusa TaxID=390896 RepID=A0A6A6IPM6_9PLEO|nr:uncharacterized protein BU26DRAFT_422632 [Trematosphaeria pertusa]KAF2252411.1 hypothetical protein BU26DRAFT_422632 [Trematosphaeria pertusa]
MSPGRSSGHSSPLKPLHLVTDMDGRPHHQSRQGLVDFDEIKRAHEEDAALKARIRRLRVISRVLAFLISIAVFIPITLTLHKFLTTQNTYHDVAGPDGSTTRRTAWAKDSKVWPTWMYFLIAGVSLLLNFVILFSYKFGIETANKAAMVATTFTWVVMLGNLVVWSVAASLYRTEKDKDGKSNDLWGWTCSAAARAIQKEFAKEVDFDRFCSVQSISWYIGLVQVAAAVLTVVIYVFVLMRRRSKKKLKRQSKILSQYPDNY